MRAKKKKERKPFTQRAEKFGSNFWKNCTYNGVLPGGAFFPRAEGVFFSGDLAGWVVAFSSQILWGEHSFHSPHTSLALLSPRSKLVAPLR